MNWKEVSVAGHADSWGREHYCVVPRELTEWLEKNMPSKDRVPAVLGVIFHVYPHMMSKFFGESATEKATGWDQLVGEVAKNFVNRGFNADTFAQTLTRMSYVRSERGIEKWDFSTSPALSIYERQVQEGMLRRSLIDGQFALDSDFYRVFSQAIHLEYDKYVDDTPDIKARHLDDLIKEGPILA